MVGNDEFHHTYIDVLFSGKWMSVPSYGQAPYHHDQITLHNGQASYHHDQISLHNGSLYALGSNFIYCCKVESLLANCTQTGEDHGNKFWKTIPLPQIHVEDFVMLSFEQHLLAAGKRMTYVYSPNTQSWVFSGDLLPVGAHCAVTFGDHRLVKTSNYLYHLKATAGMYMSLISQPNNYTAS